MTACISMVHKVKDETHSTAHLVTKPSSKVLTNSNCEKQRRVTVLLKNFLCTLVGNRLQLMMTDYDITGKKVDYKMKKNSKRKTNLSAPIQTGVVSSKNC